ncbi:MAG TPA: hypothetical protein VFI47_00330 [Acidimicrobiales bacterium]|nr:hypothetical protein [Acidimicrobiales bacterium]
MLLVATALLSSGALQLAGAAGDDACCAEGRGEEGKDASCPDCPPGLACACCPIRGAVQTAVLDVAPAPSPGAAIAVTIAEPSRRASVTDIFHPPRA